MRMGSDELVCRYQFPLKLPVIFFWINIGTFLSYLRYVPILIKNSCLYKHFPGPSFHSFMQFIKQFCFAVKTVFFFFFCSELSGAPLWTEPSAVVPSAQTWIVIVFNNNKKNRVPERQSHDTAKSRGKPRRTQPRIACHCSLMFKQWPSCFVVLFVTLGRLWLGGPQTERFLCSKTRRSSFRHSADAFCLVPQQLGQTTSFA